MKLNKKVLAELCDAPGVSGDERSIRALIVSKIRDKCDTITIDSTGGIIAFKEGFGNEKKKIMVVAHMDEIGLIVSSITQDGYIKFKTVGGIDAKVLLAKRVRIGKNKIEGAIGIKAVHLLTKKERETPVKEKDMYIEIGASSKEEALKLIKPGDYIYFDVKLEEFGDHLIKGKALDDRVGCFALIQLMEECYPNDMYFCFTTQEEVGLRGAAVTVQTVRPDVAVAVETTTCHQTPGTKSYEMSTRLGEGPAITILDRTTYVNERLRDALVHFAKPYPFQFKNVQMGGNDAGRIHITGTGIPTVILSLPCRYIHSPISVLSLLDLENLIYILKSFLKEGDFKCWSK